MELNDNTREISDIIKKVKELDKKYKDSIVGRKEICEVLISDLSSLKDKVSVLYNEVSRVRSDYEFKTGDYITDVKLALSLILRLANNKEEKYEIRPFYSNCFISPETKHGERNHELVGSSTLIIGEKTALDSLDCSKVYFGSDLGKETLKLVENGNSLIIVSNDYFSGCKPGYLLRTFTPIVVDEFDIRGSGSKPDISCYLFDDELKVAVEKFLQFVSVNGYDIEGLDEDDLYEAINNQYESKKDQPAVKKLTRKDNNNNNLQ
jgi:hypothetical protein